MRNPIDVWDFSTFDIELQTALSENEELICSYMLTDREIETEYHRCDNLVLPRTNQFNSRFIEFRDAFSTALNDRIIRAWHYTRLTDAEVDSIRGDGIELSTLESLRRRLNALIEDGKLNQCQADAIYNSSIFHGNQHNHRTGQFWMTSHPVTLDRLR